MHFKKFLNEVKRQQTSKQLYHRNVQTFWTFWKQIIFLKKREERTCTKILIEMLELVMNSMKQSINENQKCYEGHELRLYRIELKWSVTSKIIKQWVAAYFKDWSFITWEGVGGVLQGGGGVGAPEGGHFRNVNWLFGSQIRERVHLINFMKVVKSIRGGGYSAYEMVGDARRLA